MPPAGARPFSDDEKAMIIYLKENRGLSWRDIAAAFSRVFQARTAGSLQVHYCRKLQKRGSKQQAERDDGLDQTEGHSAKDLSPSEGREKMDHQDAHHDKGRLTFPGVSLATRFFKRRLPKSQHKSKYAVGALQAIQQAPEDSEGELEEFPDPLFIPVFHISPEMTDLEAFSNLNELEKEAVLDLVKMSLGLGAKTEVEVGHRFWH